MKKLNFNLFFTILAFIFLFGLLLGNSFSYLDPDFGWHLKVGEWINFNGGVPHQNIYNYTYAGNWVDHEWLSNLGLFHLYNQFGYLGVNIVFSIIGLFIFLLLYLQVRRRVVGMSVYLVLFFILFAFLAVAPSFGVRIQMLGVLFLMLLLALFRIYERGRSLVFLSLGVPLLFLWSMAHASFLIGLFVFVAWAAYKTIERFLSASKWWPRIFVADNVFTIRELACVWLVFLFSLSITWLTPYRGELYSFLGGYSNTLYMLYIQEWKSQFNYPFLYWQWLYLGLGACALILLAMEAFKGEKKVNAWEIFLFVLFFILSFKSRRHTPLFVAVSFVPIVSAFAGTVSYSGAKAWRFAFWQKTYILSVLVVVIALKFWSINYVTNVWSGFCEDYPCGAARFLELNSKYDDYRIFNEYGAGGYLIGRLPDRSLFIDGRLPQLMIGGRTFLEKYLDFYRKESDRGELFARDEIRLALVSVKNDAPAPKKWEKIIFHLRDEDFNQVNNLKEYLDGSPDWKVVYEDSYHRLYFRP